MAMSFPDCGRWRLKFLAAAAAAILVLAGFGMLPRGRSGIKAAFAGTAETPPENLSPVPVPGPLSKPRSLKLVGAPVQQILAEIPADNPQTPEKIALGEKLFFDPRLSVDDTVACASCHDPERAFTDGRTTSVGVKGRVGQRNSPTILNALFNKEQFWDGRAKTLEDQSGLVITNPSEMGQPSLDAAVAKIAAIPEYRQAFQQVFGEAPNALNLSRAIASYERTLISFDSPFDRFIAGDRNAIDDAAKRGWVLFNTRAHCDRCHASVNMDAAYFTDFDFHNIGIGILRHNVVPTGEPGRAPHQKGRSPGDRQGRYSGGLVGARPLSPHQETVRCRFLQDPQPAQRAGDRALFPRWFTRDSLGCHGSLQ